MRIVVRVHALKLPFAGIVDTGSDLTWLQCRPCARCYLQSDPVYEPSYSATYRELDCAEELCEHLPTSFCNLFTDTCDYMYSYGDKSYTYGTLSTDTFTLESTTGQVGPARDLIYFTIENTYQLTTSSPALPSNSVTL